MAERGYLAGQSIDRYEFEELIGHGAYGEVYRAFDHRLLRHVAIKASDPALAEHPGKLAELSREARIHARVEHANIVPVYDILDHQQSLLIVMRLVEGEDLGELADRAEGPLSVLKSLGLMRQVMRGIHHAHGRNVIHLDLKPGNIRVSPTGEALVLDFGIARLLDGSHEGWQNPYGSPAYMAPEQIDGRFTDARADIYALGITLYRLLTGRHPFMQAVDVEQMLQHQLQTEPPPPSRFNTELVPELDQVILRALAKEPRDRFRSCRDFSLALLTSRSRDCPDGLELEEGRWDARAQVMVKSRLQVVGTTDFISAETIDLSVSGASFRVQSDLPVGARVKVELYLPVEDDYHKIQAETVILWMDRDPVSGVGEAGMNFVDISDMDKQHISLMVRDLLLAQGNGGLPGEKTVQLD